MKNFLLLFFIQWVSSEDPTCGENEYYDECGIGCRPSCARIHNDITTPCGSECLPGCYCKPGFLYDEVTKRCVEVKDCSKVICSKNQTFSECGSNKDSRCDSDRVWPEDEDCKVGCFCKKGFYFDPYTNKCVNSTDCSSGCDENQEYLECGSKCPDTCENWADLHAKFKCGKTCVPGCFCRPGYVFSDEEERKCVLKGECKISPKCGENEYYSDKVNDCINCHNYKTTTCRQGDKPGCACNPGFYRGPEDKCHPTSMCEDVKCAEKDPNSIFTKCAVCIPSCQQKTDYLCPPICKEGCKCKEGFWKDDISGRCVTDEECNRILEEVARVGTENLNRKMASGIKENQEETAKTERKEKVEEDEIIDDIFKPEYQLEEVANDKNEKAEGLNIDQEAIQELLKTISQLGNMMAGGQGGEAFGPGVMDQLGKLMGDEEALKKFQELLGQDKIIVEEDDKKGEDGHDKSHHEEL